jgi:hypothetical protein
MGIVQGPVAVDETIGDVAGIATTRQETMTVGQGFLEFGQSPAEVGRGVIVVMEVNFDLAEARPAKFGERFQVAWFVFLGGIKKRVLGRSAVAVAKPGEESRIGLDPVIHPSGGDVGGSVAPLGLEVIGDAEQNVDRFPRPRRTTSRGIAKIIKEATVHPPRSEPEPTGQARYSQ